MIMTEYLPILIFLILAFGISFGAIFFSLVVGEKDSYKDKNSTYECGFDPFDDSRGRFEVKFYLVAILFIIFDLEIIFSFLGLSLLKIWGYSASINDVFPISFNHWICL